MTRKHALIAITLLAAWPAASQSAEERRRVMEIRGRAQRNEPVTAEERAIVQKFMRAEREQFARSHPPRESTGLVPLPDLAGGSYQGEEGGLYPGGANTPPAPHLAAGQAIARRVAPIDGRIVMVSIGMSNTTQESQAFLRLLQSASGVNPRFLFVDCAQGGQTAAITADPAANYWTVAAQRLSAAGVRPESVQVAWLKQANAGPVEGFPGAARGLESDLAATLHNLHDKYANLKLVFLSSRIYGGWALTPLNPEPYAYESAFAVKRVIAAQIAGKPELNYNPARGVVRAPWIAWGPYLWADGLKGRQQDQLVWMRADLADDGTHPSPSGRDKVARLLFDFLLRDPASRPWFSAH